MALAQTPTRTPAPSRPTDPSLLARLGSVMASPGPELGKRLIELDAWVREGLAAFSREMATIDLGESLIERSARHLLHIEGKHVRPLCVVMAARAGAGFGPSAVQLAVAVELVHSATLLHDDVVDQADTRRGKPAARTAYGNAASIFAGDWLLIEALRRIRSSGIDGLLDEMLAVIDEMILAESVQLEARGRINTSIDDYFRIVEGKTAALFRWAMLAGARAGQLPDSQCHALERYGHHIGVAFQAVDDLLDIDGDQSVTGKALFADLREGKMTYPLIRALERDQDLLAVLEECAALPAGEPLPGGAAARVIDSLSKTGALDDCRALARQHAAQAIDALAELPDGKGRQTLVVVAQTTAAREK